MPVQFDLPRSAILLPGETTPVAGCRSRTYYFRSYDGSVQAITMPSVNAILRAYEDYAARSNTNNFAVTLPHVSLTKYSSSPEAPRLRIAPYSYERAHDVASDEVNVSITLMRNRGIIRVYLIEDANGTVFFNDPNHPLYYHQSFINNAIHDMINNGNSRFYGLSNVDPAMANYIRHIGGSPSASSSAVVSSPARARAGRPAVTQQSVNGNARTRPIPQVDPLDWSNNFALFRSCYSTIVSNEGVSTIPFNETCLGDFHTVGAVSDLGRSFGLEIEVDFPNSTAWGTEKQQLATALYLAGLSRDSEVHGWHYAARVNNGRGHDVGYSSNRDRWTVEFDRSVDDCGGDRGCEIVSPIMYNTPEAWADIKSVVDIVRNLGGEVTLRHGLHVNIGAADISGDYLSAMSLVRMTGRFDDVLIRLAHNPENGRWHRGRSYCARIQGGNAIHITALSGIENIMAYNGHRAMINFSHFARSESERRNSTRLEFRFFDGTLDVGRIQVYVMMCMAMLAAAIRNNDANVFNGGRTVENAGSHYETYRNRRLSGQQWRESSASYREFVDFLRFDAASAELLTMCFASSRWQRA